MRTPSGSKTALTAFSVCDGVSDCQENEDEKSCHVFVNLIFPSQLLTHVIHEVC